MLDPKLLRHDLEAVVQNLARRGVALDPQAVAAIEAQRKTCQVEVENLRNERNASSKLIGKAKAAGEDIAPLLEQVATLGSRLGNAEARLQKIEAQRNDLLSGLPNLLHDDVPDGADESANVEVRRWGSPPEFDFGARDHVELGERAGGLDFEAAAKLSGSRFAVLHGSLARLHRALIAFMLDLHTREHGYTETYVPYLVAPDALFGTGQLPKFADDLFELRGDK
ncbi:MAG TPA: serine--tRNA ligase, partial [Gammaproteobacteria bacterium]|nr:serine--tRNA ligase [Gammaproteobacteria bacterium]